jgi:hypothetical protein
MFIEKLKKEHPRLLLSDVDLKKIQQLVSQNSRARSMKESILEQCLAILNEPLIEYLIPDGLRLLGTSRLAVDRIYKLCLMYRLEGDTKFADRAIEEMLSAAEFPDWNPRHFLDTGEMTHALGIGYDWLYHYMDDTQRDLIRFAIAEKGLKAGINDMENRTHWVMRQMNWSQVCNGGLSIGALAIGDERPYLSERILSKGLVYMRRTMEEYGPDGGWKEGPTYWHYATRYNVYYLAALESAVGTDFGLSNSPGFSITGQFPFYYTSPINKFFNYADANEDMRGDGEPHEMYWLAKKFDNDLFSWYKQKLEKSDLRVLNWGTSTTTWSGTASTAESRPLQFHPLDLVWFRDDVDKGPIESALPLDAHFRKIDVAMFRSDWEDTDAVFLGLKGGDNKAPHSQLDLGSFVIDALGHRWATDLGRDNYNLPGYFDLGVQTKYTTATSQTDVARRWTYYRNRTESHNTLLINGINQDPDARATIMKFGSSPEFAFAVVELSDAYSDIESVNRGVALINRRQILIQDEVVLPENSEIIWGMITSADIELQGNTAILSIENKRMRVEILSQNESQFEIISATPPEPQAQNEGYAKLAFRVNSTLGMNRFAVLLTPYEDEEVLTNLATEIKGLGDW